MTERRDGPGRVDGPGRDEAVRPSDPDNERDGRAGPATSEREPAGRPAYDLDGDGIADGTAYDDGDSRVFLEGDG